MDQTRRALVGSGLLGAIGMSGALASLHSPSVQAQPLMDAARPRIPGLSLKRTRRAGTELGYGVVGGGPAILLLHGWPFTWYTWHRVMPVLASGFTVIAPDMRGMGMSGKPHVGYDVVSLAADAQAILTAEGFTEANVLGHDLGVGVAFQLAARYPGLVRRLALTESIVLGAPKADIFMKTPPWWVAWHNVPALPEQVIAGSEGRYLDWFYLNLTHRQVGISRAARDQHVAAYTGRDALRGGFEHYRAFGLTTEQGRDAAQRRLSMPVLALGGELVGDVLHRQMAAVADDVSGGRIRDCGHVIQEERPDELLSRLRAFL